MTKEIYKENIKIYCKHCKTTVKDVWSCKIESVIGVRYIYICTNCQASLGIYLSQELFKENSALKIITN